jgi:uncharacterized protein YndB with AHSA1/START domain
MKALVLFALCAAAHAEILDSAAGGFTVKTTLTIKAPPDEVYRRVVHNIGDWWDPMHTFSGDSHNLTIEERPGGCFCEKLPNNGFMHNMEVVYVAPGKGIVLHGALGPMQTVAASGSMQIQLAPAQGATKLDVTYSVAGYLPKGMNTWAAPLDMVLAQQFTRLKNYIETGNPVASK